MFASVKNNWKKAEAASVLESIFEEMSFLLDGSSPAKMANFLVGKVWDLAPQEFDGRFGVRPHKLAIAAVALSTALERAPREGSSYPILLMALGRMFSGMEGKMHLLPLSRHDELLFERAFAVLSKCIEHEESIEDQEENPLS